MCGQDHAVHREKNERKDYKWLKNKWVFDLRWKVCYENNKLTEKTRRVSKISKLWTNGLCAWRQNT